MPLKNHINYNKLYHDASFQFLFFLIGSSSKLYMFTKTKLSFHFKNKTNKTSPKTTVKYV